MNIDWSWSSLWHHDEMEKWKNTNAQMHSKTNENHVNAPTQPNDRMKMGSTKTHRNDVQNLLNQSNHTPFNTTGRKWNNKLLTACAISLLHRCSFHHFLIPLSTIALSKKMLKMDPSWKNWITVNGTLLPPSIKITQNYPESVAHNKCPNMAFCTDLIEN